MRLETIVRSTANNLYDPGSFTLVWPHPVTVAVPSNGTDDVREANCIYSLIEIDGICKLNQCNTNFFFFCVVFGMKINTSRLHSNCRRCVIVSRWCQRVIIRRESLRDPNQHNERLSKFNQGWWLHKSDTSWKNRRLCNEICHENSPSRAWWPPTILVIN